MTRRLRSSSMSIHGSRARKEPSRRTQPWAQTGKTILRWMGSTVTLETSICKSTCFASPCAKTVRPTRTASAHYWCALDVQDLEMWIGETGWPTAGHEKATLVNAYWSTENVIRRAQGLYLNDDRRDTARFKGLPMTVFLFEAFDEQKKFQIEHGNIFENSFGIFYEDGTPKWRDANGMIKFGIPGKKTHVSKPPPPTEPTLRS